MTQEELGTAKEKFFLQLKKAFESLSLKDALYPIREKAWKQFVVQGLPDKTSEAFQYAPLRKFYEDSTTQGSFPKQIVDIPAFIGATITLVNGVFCKELSSLEALPEGIVVLSLEEAMGSYGAFIHNRILRSCKEEKDPFALLNISLHRGGVFLYVPPNYTVDVPVRIYHRVTGEDANCRMISPRLHLFVAASSSLTVEMVIADDAGVCVNEVIDVALEDGACLSYVNRSRISEESWIFSALRATTKNESTLQSIQVTEGSKMVRSSYHVILHGEHAKVDIKGLQRLKENRQAHAHVIIQHEAPNCISNQLFKTVLEDVSQASFEGKIFIQKKAQKTEAYQLSKSLLLGEYAMANCKPNLEIYADDVKASHGATVGRLQDEELFYLQTRGISESKAKELLLIGFCAEILQDIPLVLQEDKQEEITCTP